MVSERKRLMFETFGFQPGSPLANTTQETERGKHPFRNFTDDLALISANSNSGNSPPAARAMSAPHPVLADDVPDPKQQDSTSQNVTVKPEPGTNEALHNASSPAPAVEITTSDAAVKAEQASEDWKADKLSKPPKEITLKGLRHVADSMDLAKLETGVVAAQEVLDQLRTPLRDFKEHQELRDWLSRIETLKVKAQKAGRTVIAVAGGTGAGKSSLINAVLDEEKLLPTNGMRACTAVITEVSWNEVDNPQQAYRAEVEFISPEEWGTELRLMYDEILDDKGQLIPSWRDNTTEAGIAYDKVEAVYPELSQDMIMKSKPKDLVQSQAIASFLGTTKKFAYSNAQDLYSDLTKVIDSKDKVGSKHKKSMALWPIIRVVKIFVRANALSTGVVLVDLPGTADSNAARSAVATKYMAECTSVWVVARITRAVDDKEAKTLLGRSSRIQMKLDGAYSHLTFIATQTDGIDIQETIDAVDGDGQIKATYAREQELNATIGDAKHRIRGLEKQLYDLNEEFEVLEGEMKTWGTIQKKKKKGQQVYAPAATPKPSSRPKRRRTMPRQIVHDGSGSEDESGKSPLTQNEISVKIEELEAAYNAKVVENESVEKQVEINRADLRRLEQQKTDLAAERVSLCMEKRNNYCRDAIRQDFAAGIREIDEEDASEDTENYDPSVQKRDYDEVASSLDVFCISSKAYQQLRKTARTGSPDVEGFRILEDTEIPGLQQHAMISARTGQIRSNKSYLNQFSQVLNSLNVWAACNELSLQPGQSGHADLLSEESKGYEMEYLEVQLGELRKQFAKIIFDTKTELLKIFRDAFGQRSSTATAYASKQLLNIVVRWGSLEKDGGYGLTCLTYKATCRRGGEKTPNKKARNFNEDVLEPLLSKIASCWEQIFTRDIPAALDRLLAIFMKKIRGFHTLVSSRPEMQKGKVNSMHILATQIANHEATMQEAINDAKSQIHEEQRFASRLLLPEIKSEMQKVYRLCAAEKGPGCFKRMKDLMLEHIRKHKTNVYKRACQKVNKTLETVFQSIAESLYDDCEHIRDTMASDYKLILTSAEMIEVNAVVRDRIREVLRSADDKFEAILVGLEPMSVDPVI